ncbi:unnamed protein product, partial [marine sediment metagenome]
ELPIGIDRDPAQLLPQLLDHLQALGELAKQISHAMGGNGHRAGELSSQVPFVHKPSAGKGGELS